MKPRNIAFLVIFILVVAVLSYIVIRPNIFDLEISMQKCNDINIDDCWHSLAHNTLNAAYCYNINDSELEEHCIEHISNNSA